MSPAKLLGQPTRGKTAPNRLRKTDTFLAVAHTEFVRHMPGWYVDLGYGFYPVTSVETLRRLRRLNPDLEVLGVEIDPQRVADATKYAEPGLSFRLGGFNLPMGAGERVSVIRAFNVLRQYDQAAVAEALRALAAALTEHGLMLEGTSDPLGHLLAFNVFEKEGGQMRRTALVLAPALRQEFQPRQFQAVLPKNFIHHAQPGGPIDRFFTDWHAAWQHARREAGDPRQIFGRASLRLADHYGYGVDRRPALLRRGFLVLGAEWPGRRG
jgi:hypothetical protein